MQWLVSCLSSETEFVTRWIISKISYNHATQRFIHTKGQNYLKLPYFYTKYLSAAAIMATRILDEITPSY